MSGGRATSSALHAGAAAARAGDGGARVGGTGGGWADARGGDAEPGAAAPAGVPHAAQAPAAASSDQSAELAKARTDEDGNRSRRRVYAEDMRCPSFALSALACLAAVGVARPAAACGLTPPVGPTGLPATCRGESKLTAVRLGLVGGGTRTKIDFGDERASLSQAALVLALDVQLLGSLTVGASAGLPQGGTLEYRGQSHELSGKSLFGVSAAYRLIDDGLLFPFVQVSLGYSVSHSTTRAPSGAVADFDGKDWRAGLLVGKTFLKLVAPYVMGRYFGAGTEWAPGGGHGSDHYRYHVGAGAALALGEHLDAVAELAVLGEQRLSIGAGYTF